MKEYFVVLISTVFAGGMLVSLTPSGSFQKYMRFMCGIAVCGCIMMPLLSGEVFEKIDTVSWNDYWEAEQEKNETYDEIYNSSLKYAGIKNAEEYLKALIIKDLSAKDEDFDVSIITNSYSDEICIKQIEVIIHATGVALDPRRIENIVFGLFDCELVFIYD